ncbi:MAG TPA: hypothetical protein VFR96_03555 [Povalibacter sp.]|jgi:hypothetical protein|nr:hypothetical protein [Povalibacter sp.]
MKRIPILALALLALLPQTPRAEPALANGTTVRITSNAVEGGWLTGHLFKGADHCWMVKLDKPTRDHYTMLSLLVVDRLEVSAGAGWSAVAVKPVLNASPAACREYGAD